jgi:hypothetical protein
LEEKEMRTNHWRRLVVVSGAIFLTLLVMGVFSLFRSVLGINYGIISGLLDTVTVIAAVLAVVHVECVAYNNREYVNDHPAVTREKHQESDMLPESEVVAVQGDDGEIWFLDENGMSPL